VTSRHFGASVLHWHRFRAAQVEATAGRRVHGIRNLAGHDGVVALQRVPADDPGDEDELQRGDELRALEAQTFERSADAKRAQEARDQPSVTSVRRRLYQRLKPSLRSSVRVR
jgi:hypothetical protein